MLPSQTIEILKILDKKELKKFGDFLRSPYFNNLTALIKIFDEVKKEHPVFKGNLLQPEKIFKKLYPADDFKETRIQNLYAEFGTLLKKFLGYEKFAAEKTYIDMYTSEALMDKNLNKISQKLINKFLEENNDELLSASDNFYKIKSIGIYNLQALREQGSEFYPEKVNDLKETLMIFFFTNLFQILSIEVKDEKLFDRKKKNDMNEIFDIVNVEKLFAYFEKNNSLYASYLKVNYYMQHYELRDINEVEFNMLKKEILKIINFTPKKNSSIIIINVIQIILGKLIPKDKKYYKEIFEFSKLFCELKIFPNEAIANLGNGPFSDMFTVAIILKEFDWAENFVKEYSQYLNEEYRDNQKNYSMGILSFKKKKYEESLNYFNKVDMVDIFEKVNLRFYYMMNYIELEAYESALSALHTIRQFYTDSKEIPEIARVLIPDALKYFGEIIKCGEEGKKVDGLLYKKAHSGKRFYHAAYIREKMESLK